MANVKAETFQLWHLQIIINRMIEIDKTIVSLDVVTKRFVCDLKECKGACCIEGDGGAPLEDAEIDKITKYLPHILPYLNEISKQTIEQKGVYIKDDDGDKLTMLNPGLECSFSIIENGIMFCGIEKAFNEGKIQFRKPISCYLYPIRLTKYTRFEAVNYHSWNICKCAREKGKTEDIRVYEFLKKPLIEKFGQEWYDVLDSIVKANNGFESVS